MENKAQLEALNLLIRGFYDMQKLRIASGNRLARMFFARLGIEDGQAHEDASAKVQDVLEKLNEEYKRIADGILEKLTRDQLFGCGSIIASEADFRLIESYKNLLKLENKAELDIAPEVEQFEIWKRFLKQVRGIGPLTGAILINYIDPHKAETPSAVFKFCGLDVVHSENDAGELVGHARGIQPPAKSMKHRGFC